MLPQALHLLANVVFPPVCEGCQSGLPFSQISPICENCSSKINEITPPTCSLCARPWSAESPCPSCKDFHPAYDRVWAAFNFDEALKPVFHAYKFKHRRTLKKFFADKLCLYAQARFKNHPFDAIVAVPPNPSTLVERGFHPARDLAKALSNSLKTPDNSHWLGTHGGHAQVSLSRTERLKNIRNRFFYKGPRKTITDMAILLVDDVLTTGSTASECSSVLKSAGAKHVTALCLARGSWR